MSTITNAAPAHVAAGGAHLSFGGVLRSEWIKFRSLLSTQLLLIFTFLAIVGVGTLAAWMRATVVDSIITYGAGTDGVMTSDGNPKMTVDQAVEVANQQGINIYGTPIAGIQLGILILGALAVLFISSEFGTGMIRSTFAAVPKRLPVFFAKAIVLAVVSYVVTLVAAFVTALIAMPIYAAYDIPFNFGTEGVLSSIFLGGVYVAGVAIMGLSLGTILRNSAGAIIVLVAIFFLLEIGTSLLTLVPGDFWKYVGQYVPSVAGGRMLEIGDKDAFISPVAGGFIYLGWILAAAIPAMFLIKKRDV